MSMSTPSPTPSSTELDPRRTPVVAIPQLQAPEAERSPKTPPGTYLRPPSPAERLFQDHPDSIVNEEWMDLGRRTTIGDFIRHLQPRARPTPHLSDTPLLPHEAAMLNAIREDVMVASGNPDEISRIFAEAAVWRDANGNVQEYPDQIAAGLESMGGPWIGVGHDFRMAHGYLWRRLLERPLFQYELQEMVIAINHLILEQGTSSLVGASGSGATTDAPVVRTFPPTTVWSEVTIPTEAIEEVVMHLDHDPRSNPVANCRWCENPPLWSNEGSRRQHEHLASFPHPQHSPEERVTCLWCHPELQAEAIRRNVQRLDEEREAAAHARAAQAAREAILARLLPEPPVRSAAPSPQEQTLPTAQPSSPTPSQRLWLPSSDPTPWGFEHGRTSASALSRNVSDQENRRPTPSTEQRGVPPSYTTAAETPQSVRVVQESRVFTTEVIRTLERLNRNLEATQRRLEETEPINVRTALQAEMAENGIPPLEGRSYAEGLDARRTLAELREEIRMLPTSIGTWVPALSMNLNDTRTFLTRLRREHHLLDARMRRQAEYLIRSRTRVPIPNHAASERARSASPMGRTSTNEPGRRRSPLRTLQVPRLNHLFELNREAIAQQNEDPYPRPSRSPRRNQSERPTHWQDSLTIAHRRATRIAQIDEDIARIDQELEDIEEERRRISRRLLQGPAQPGHRGNQGGRRGRGNRRR